MRGKDDLMKGRINMIKGRINSFQSMGAVDGPGVRFVVFMQGCPLRCVYCHNPDTWGPGGEEYGVEEVLEKARRFRPYFGDDGGVTVSGGEPLTQWEFVSELFRRLKEEGFHTALDTSGTGGFRGVSGGENAAGGREEAGCASTRKAASPEDTREAVSPTNARETVCPEGARKVLKYTDLVLCDLKFSTEEEYRRYCGGRLTEVLSFLELTEQMRVPLWIRHVIVPGLTDGEESVSGIAEMAKRFANLKKVELLPFKKLCVSKYEALGIPFPLADYNECTNAKMKEVLGVIGLSSKSSKK